MALVREALIYDSPVGVIETMRRMYEAEPSLTDSEVVEAVHRVIENGEVEWLVDGRLRLVPPDPDARIHNESSVGRAARAYRRKP
jgi:hypothetical protein